jgi:hypothetical protein
MKRALLFAAAAILLAALGINWLRQQRVAAARLAQWEAERADNVKPPALDISSHWEHAELSLGEFVKLVAARSGLKVQLDRAALEREWKSKPEDATVIVPEGDWTIDEMLAVALQRLGLHVDIRGGAIVLTTWANSDSRRQRTVVYPVPHPQPAGFTESDWEQLIAGNIDGHAHKVPDAIIVVADPANHQRARLVIESIRALRQQPPQAIAIPVPFSDAELRIRAELEQETSVDFVEHPLKDVAIYLSERHNIPLILAVDKLQEASVSFNTPITKQLRAISLRSALNLILKDLELSFMVRDQALVITTPDDAERDRTIAYNVHDLIDMAHGFLDVNWLSEIIRRTIAPDRWSYAMGAGPRSAGTDWLVIDQSDAVHEQIAALLATLRQMLAIERHGPSQPVETMGQTERRIRAALELPMKLDLEGHAPDQTDRFDFGEMPLKDALLFLGDVLKIPIVVSVKKLDEAAISPDTTVTLRISPVSARTTFEEMLKPVTLDFLIRDEVLQITTPEDSESHLITRIYDTRTILKRVPDDQLRDFVKDSLQPDSWNYWGNAVVFRGLLVVCQTDRVHEEVERIVEKMTADLQEGK